MAKDFTAEVQRVKGEQAATPPLGRRVLAACTVFSDERFEKADSESGTTIVNMLGF